MKNFQQYLTEAVLEEGIRQQIFVKLAGFFKEDVKNGKISQEKAADAKQYMMFYMEFIDENKRAAIASFVIEKPSENNKLQVARETDGILKIHVVCKRAYATFFEKMKNFFKSIPEFDVSYGDLKISATENGSMFLVADSKRANVEGMKKDLASTVKSIKRYMTKRGVDPEETEKILQSFQFVENCNEEDESLEEAKSVTITLTGEEVTLILEALAREQRFYGNGTNAYEASENLRKKILSHFH